MSIYRFILIIIILFVPLTVLSDKSDDTSVEKLYINDDFFKEYRKVPDIMRDEYWKEKLNCIITARGTVTEIKACEKYKKKFCIKMNDNDAERYGQTFLYYVYIENKDSYEMLSVDEMFEFSGQLIAFTPLSVDRGKYIFDVLLEKGAILVK